MPKGDVDMAADVLFTDQFFHTGILKHLHHAGIDTGQHHFHPHLPAHTAHIREVVHTGRINERHLAHTDDADFGPAAHIPHHLFEFVADTEEIGAVDLIDFGSLRYDQMLQIALHIGIGIGVNLVTDDGDIGGLRHALHTKQAGNQHTDLDGDGQVENDSQEESHQKDDDVGFGVLKNGLETAPLAHIVGNDDQHTRQASHRNILDQRHEKQVDERQHYGVNDSGKQVPDKSFSVVRPVEYREQFRSE